MQANQPGTRSSPSNALPGAKVTISLKPGSLCARFDCRLVLAVLCLLLVGPSHSQELERGFGLVASGAAKDLSGVEVIDVTAADANRQGWIAPRGAKARSVKKGSPADRAGIAVNDIVVSIDGREISNATAFRDLVTKSPAGSQLHVRLLRARKERLVTLVLPSAALPQPKPAPPAKT